MKYIIISFSLILFSCQYRNTKDNAVHVLDEQYRILQQETPVDSIVGAYLHLDRIRHNFGIISSKKMPKITIEFEMENKGKIPLVILKADVSCGCMTVNYPKTPIFATQKAILTVTINTKNQIGIFNKPIFVKTNAENDVVLIRILGEIQK